MTNIKSYSYETEVTYSYIMCIREFTAVINITKISLENATTKQFARENDHFRLAS